MLTVRYIDNEEELLQEAFTIRETVFVKEQHVSKEEEYDEFEASSRHFLAYYEGNPCGTARWRYTEKGIKLERFAVLAEFRSKKVGSALLQALLKDVAAQNDTAGKLIYLHAQVTAMPFYTHFGFSPVGEMFEECNIQHYKMIKTTI
ncbi:GNAT family N-acetyltransferase [Xanthocytophaga agilis]|uniref:GNAT family N-acetyltransferase n=1 Tax=Xanthocytophaga agilis TaxID=3048010 RepID=A0AAE3R695_9BACT|nr:GNAT family N-acetyltransferase [Xanthocytophaga agilis]MDJ1504524.1 GNAT family N-acetyltransferase [Xanthocytophaga agilis]